MSFDVDRARSLMPVRDVEHHLLAVTIEAVSLEWVRRREAPVGSVVLADSEVSPRRMRGVPVLGRGPAMAIIADAAEPEGLVTLRAGLALAEALGDGSECGWPNTVHRHGEVVGLVAVEPMAPRFGRQVAAIRWRTSDDVTAIAVGVVQAFDIGDVVDRYLIRCPWIGRQVSIDLIPRGSVEAVVEGISQSGALKLRMGSGRVGDLPVEQAMAVRIAQG